MSPLSAWTPGPGPIYSLITSTWTGLNLPTPPIELRTWVSGQSPLSTNKAVVAAIGTYLLIIFGGREIMKSRPAFKLTGPFRVHNIFLTLISGLLLLLMIEEILPIWLKHGTYFSICNNASFTPRLVTFYMINYYIKYVELIDTVFLVLKKKPLAFLHVFHHAATAILCFTQLEGQTSVQWVVITLNLTVHVIMYYYYYATAGGAKIWASSSFLLTSLRADQQWKKYLTSMQITQFVIDLFIVYFASTLLVLHRYQRFAYKYLPFLPHVEDCAGSEGAAAFGCALLTSYLFLFIAFYRATYKKSGNAAKSAQKASQKLANGSAASDIRGSEKSKVIRQDSRGTVVITEVQK